MVVPTSVNKAAKSLVQWFPVTMKCMALYGGNWEQAQITTDWSIGVAWTILTILQLG
jgi:hypothetical protein